MHRLMIFKAIIVPDNNKLSRLQLNQKINNQEMFKRSMNNFNIKTLKRA